MFNPKGQNYMVYSCISSPLPRLLIALLPPFASPSQLFPDFFVDLHSCLRTLAVLSTWTISSDPSTL